MMVNYNSMGPSLQLVRARFFNFLLSKLSSDFKLHGMSTLQDFKGPYFRIALCSSHKVRYAGSPVSVVHADMTDLAGLHPIQGQSHGAMTAAPFQGLLFFTFFSPWYVSRCKCY